MTKVSAFLVVYNEKEFIPYFLNNIIPVFDDIVIVEGTWDGGPYDYKGNFRSDDGTREIIDYLANSHPEKITVLDSIGDDCMSFNWALHHCKNDWVWFFGADEFYRRSEMIKAIKAIDENPDCNALIFPEYSFYFNFRRFIRGYRMRLVNFSGRNFYTANRSGDHINPQPDKVVQFNDCLLHHYQWVGNRNKVIKSKNVEFEKEVLGKLHEKPGWWQWWTEEIYLKFDGTEEKERELLEKAKGSFHPWSYRDPEFRNLVLETLPLDHVHPEYIRSAPFFDLFEKGIIDFNAHKAAHDNGNLQHDAISKGVD